VADSISFTQFLFGITKRDGTRLDHGCGVRDRSALSKALKGLERRGLICSCKRTDSRGRQKTTKYFLSEYTYIEAETGRVRYKHDPMRIP
jgi:hypothetical protein